MKLMSYSLEASSKTAATDTDESDYDIDPQDQPDSKVWKATWPLYFEQMHISEDLADLHLSIGKGSSDEGPDRGVDILVICPGKPPMGVIKNHAIIRLHPESGFPMIGGVNDKHPVDLQMLDGGYEEFGTGRWHILCQFVNRFTIGELQCTLTYSAPTQKKLDAMRRVRDEIFKRNGFEAPDARLPVLPFDEALRHVGPTFVFDYIASGAFALVGIGVDEYTGKVWAVKSIPIKKESTREEIVREVKVALQLSVSVIFNQFGTSELILCIG